jgi:DnaJ-class molecular chaperone
MTTLAFSSKQEELMCDAPCFNTNVFAPGGYKVRCDQCRGRRGHYDANDRWVECAACQGTGSVRCPRCNGSGKLISGAQD